VLARLWSARATPAQSGSYLAHFSKAVLPELRKFSGYAGATVVARDIHGHVEILVTTLWKNREAIDAFAGPDCEAAVVAPEAAALLTDYDRRVRHFTVAVSDGSASR
jgi:heme-degrading monooxygenase HmoA